ncbi:ArgR family transcriptional regulator [Staphylococcus caledonicus]|uniref:arginine repressor n=1 Tax=Staphylococcus sp. acrmy TaxID=2929076 RepID=UPI001F5AF75B|nr:ArgR family transcriptional regulator [Staphylococcus sp. acrmy]
MKKEKRLDLLLSIIKQNNFSKKQEIVDYLVEHFDVYCSLTTISRDLDKLEVYKIPISNNKYFYKQISQSKQIKARRKLKTYSEEIHNIIIKDSYILVKTSPGFAQSINYYIDQLKMKEILGTIGGNDTIMILTTSNERAKYICYQLFNASKNEG